MRINVKEKRNELIWALAFQGFTYAEIGEMFNIDRSTIMRIINSMPKEWQPKWVKKD